MPAEKHGYSRRSFFRTAGGGLAGAGLAGAGLAGGSATLLSGCGAAGEPKPRLLTASGPAVRHADIALLNGVLELERTAVVAYTAGIPFLTGHAHAAATNFLGQELAHAGKLISVIRAAGGRPNPPPPSGDLGTPDTEADVLDTLRAAEAALVSGYLDAIPELRPGWLRAVAAGILADEAEHISVLRMVQGRPPVLHAFVTASA